jgi:hypothetical protein
LPELASQKQLVEQAKGVGAQAVLYCSDFSHTEEGVLPYLSYQPGQTFTTQEHGTIGGSPYWGSSTTSTPGTYQTQFIPYQRRVYIQGATFWRRLKPGRCGAQFVPLTEELRAKLHRNTGVLVAAVVEGGPAFRAEVLRGDVITQVADRPASTVQDVMDAIAALAGEKVRLNIIRDGQPLSLDVQLNEVR